MNPKICSILLQLLFVKLTTNLPKTAVTYHAWPEPWWWGPVPAGLFGTITDNFGVNSTAHTVVKLSIEFWESVHCEQKNIIHIVTYSNNRCGWNKGVKEFAWINLKIFCERY